MNNERNDYPDMQKEFEADEQKKELYDFLSKTSNIGFMSFKLLFEKLKKGGKK